ncbi:MAG: hypothetical protein WBX15_10005 [Thermoanaerobaculia bacterium]
MKTGLHLLLSAALLFLLAGCSLLPWSHERGNETNLAFDLDHNLLIVPARIEGKDVRLIIASAQPQSVLSAETAQRISFAPGKKISVLLGDRTSVRVKPRIADLHGIADGILGMDAWSRRSITIDYRRGLFIVSRSQDENLPGKVYRFRSRPSIPITIGGRSVTALVDTALPDTVVLPESSRIDAGRGSPRSTLPLTVGDVDLGELDVGYASSKFAYVGNRVLANFLLTIDYRRDRLSLWPYPEPISGSGDSHPSSHVR